MNIAAGVPVERGKRLGEFSPREYFASMAAQKFNGYVCLTTAGRYGLEEGVLVFHDGVITACDYEYFKYDRHFPAEDGLSRFLNAVLAETGVLDAFSLTPYQVRLVLTLNEDCLLKQPVDGKNVPLAFPAGFSAAFEEALQAETRREEGRDELLKKLRLVKLAAPEATRTGLLKSAKKEEDSLKELFE